MALQEELVAQGNWLFRWRGHIPYILLPLFILALLQKSSFKQWIDVEPYETIWVIFCIIVAMTGQVVRALIIGFVPSNTSGRNTKQQRAGSLNTHGMYSIVRHPLYVANFFIALGIVLMAKTLWLLLLFCLLFALYYERIMLAEESFLRDKFGDEYMQWAAKTPAFLPKFKQWTVPELTFSWRMVMRREYPSLFLIGATFLFIDAVEENYIEGEPVHESLIAMFVLTALALIGLRTLKKKTTLLDVEGR